MGSKSTSSLNTHYSQTNNNRLCTLDKNYARNDHVMLAIVLILSMQAFQADFLLQLRLRHEKLIQALYGLKKNNGYEDGEDWLPYTLIDASPIFGMIMSMMIAPKLLVKGRRIVV